MGPYPTLRIGRVRLDAPLVLSPMAGFSDRPFRVLCRRHGAGLVSTEMVSVASLERGAAKTRRRADTCEEERPTSIQVFGTDPEECAEAAADLEPGLDVIGFNMGCPAQQIRATGCGAALLDDPERCAAIVRRIKEATTKPLLVKIRAGNRGPIDVVDLGRRLEAAGADGFIFHARTAAQNYAGHSDWGLVRALKKGVGVPVVANGDVVDGPSARRCLDETEADGIAIGRAALGNPRLFAQIDIFLRSGRELALPTVRDRADDFLEYLHEAVRVGYGWARILTQAQRFSRGFSGAADFRARLQAAAGAEDVRRAFQEIAAGAG